MSTAPARRGFSFAPTARMIATYHGFILLVAPAPHVLAEQAVRHGNIGRKARSVRRSGRPHSGFPENRNACAGLD
ncbi:hypothetical protein WS62_16720 [Burkholderia sp. ABCPW 14]|nr:hypothetical protein WS62_16720 [Burkholderia sp. ABCPW 14]